MDDLAFELRKSLARYVAGEISLPDFHGLAMPLTWNAEKHMGLTAAAVAREIELLLSESEHGDWTEDELRRRLAPYATTYFVRQLDLPQATSTTPVDTVSVSLSVSGSPLIRTRVVDTQPVGAS